LSNPTARRGEIWLAELDKRRPVVVLTRDPMGRVLHSVIVGPVTSTIRGLSTEVELSEDDGAQRPCVVNLDNLQLVPRARLVRRVGRAAPHTLRAICAATAQAIGCPSS
jgi:mRNA interferase MazF